MTPPEAPDPAASPPPDVAESYNNGYPSLGIPALLLPPSDATVTELWAANMALQAREAAFYGNWESAYARAEMLAQHADDADSSELEALKAENTRLSELVERQRTIIWTLRKHRSLLVRILWRLSRKSRGSLLTLTDHAWMLQNKHEGALSLENLAAVKAWVEAAVEQRKKIVEEAGGTFVAPTPDEQSRLIDTLYDELIIPVNDPSKRTSRENGRKS